MTEPLTRERDVMEAQIDCQGHNMRAMDNLNADLTRKLAELTMQLARKDQIIKDGIDDESALEREMEKFGMVFSDEHGGLHPTDVIPKFIADLTRKLAELKMQVEEDHAVIDALKASDVGYYNMMESHHALVADITKERDALKEQVDDRCKALENQAKSVNSYMEMYSQQVRENKDLTHLLADVVPRSRYDVCNRDLIEVHGKLKQVQNALAERTVKAENLLLHVLARPELGETYPKFCKLWRAECEDHP